MLFTEELRNHVGEPSASCDSGRNCCGYFVICDRRGSKCSYFSFLWTTEDVVVRIPIISYVRLEG